MLIFSASTVSTAIAADRCESVFSESRLAPNAELKSNITAALAQIRPGLISGEELPTRKDFENLQRLASLIKADSPHPRRPEQPNDRKEEFDRPESRTTIEAPIYNPIEYELKSAFQSDLAKLNRLLPRDHRIRLARLPIDRRFQKNLDQARARLKNLDGVFLNRFPSTGFRTFAEYESALREMRDPSIRAAVSMIDRNEIGVAIFVPEKIRFWIPKTGFQNQYVTQTSGGANNVSLRQWAEERLYGETSRATPSAQLDAEVSPKYGLLISTSDKVKNQNLGRAYGDDIYVLKTPSIADRLSFTFTDSLALAHRSQNDTIQNILIPWKYRLLMASAMNEALSRGEFGWPSTPSMLENPPHANAYYETQIAGPVRLSDVKTFAFTKTPPKGVFLLELLRLGIEIRDARAEAGKKSFKVNVNFPGRAWVPTPAEIAAARLEAI